MSKTNKTKSSLGFALNYIWSSDKALILLEILFGAITALIPLINIFIPAKIIGIISTSKDTMLLIIYSSIAVFGNGILIIVSNILDGSISKRITLLGMKESNDISKKVFKVEYPNLEDAKFEGDLNKYKMQWDSPFFTLLWVISSLAKGVVGLVLSLTMISPFFGVLFKTTGEGFLHSPWYGVTIIGVVIVVAVVVLITASIINKKCYKLSSTFASYERMFSFFQERLNDYNSGKDVRLYSQQDIIFDSAMGSIVNKGVSVYNKMNSLTAKQSGLIAVIGALVGFGIYSIIGLKGLAGFLGLESVVLCVGGMMQVVSGITNLSTVTGRLNYIIPRVNDFNNLMQARDEVDTELKIDNDFKEINVNNVSFKYKEELPLSLENISFNIRRGDKIALVGQNGSGKSTFIKLLCGLYPPTEGSFELDNVPINGYNSKDWRKLFSVVFQDSTIFSYSLSQNIACEEECDIDKLKLCLSQVGIVDRVEKMSDKYDSYLYKHLSDKGVEISGGEAQKIAMARALYKDAPIMILDEPTAALDPFAEQEIYSKFNELTMDKTVFYISHRLSSCYFCNMIVVFDEGKMVQFGTHNQLLKDAQGKYYQLWNAQAKYYVK